MWKARTGAFRDMIESTEKSGDRIEIMQLLLSPFSFVLRSTSRPYCMLLPMSLEPETRHPSCCGTRCGVVVVWEELDILVRVPLLRPQTSASNLSTCEVGSRMATWHFLTAEHHVVPARARASLHGFSNFIKVGSRLPGLHPWRPCCSLPWRFRNSFGWAELLEWFYRWVMVAFHIFLRSMGTKG